MNTQIPTQKNLQAAKEILPDLVHDTQWWPIDPIRERIALALDKKDKLVELNYKSAISQYMLTLEQGQQILDIINALNLSVGCKYCNGATKEEIIERIDSIMNNLSSFHLALHRYGRHGKYCKSGTFLHKNDPCTCGLEEALRNEGIPEKGCKHPPNAE